jgi:FMN phosphatase YigB (HAD superfamily)
LCLQILECTACKIFCITNIFSQHALKCLKLLNLQYLFDGIIYVDYSVDNFAAKPDRDSYLQAMCLIGQPRPDKIYFVDDTVSYVLGAEKLGWNAIHLDEFHRYDKENSVIPRISKLQELKNHLPKIFSNKKED